MSARSLARFDVVTLRLAPDWGEYVVVSIGDDGRLGVRSLAHPTPGRSGNFAQMLDVPSEFVYVRKSTPEERRIKR